MLKKGNPQKNDWFLEIKSDKSKIGLKLFDEQIKYMSTQKLKYPFTEKLLRTAFDELNAKKKVTLKL